jgi:hypothetical protein
LLNTIRLQRVIRHFNLPGKALVATLLVGLVLLLNALAACPQLHERLHKDAGSAHHQCAVTLFAHGQVDASVVAVALPVAAAPVEFLPPTLVSIPNTLVAILPPGRGPPVSLLHS